ncbi:hypothetical protein [Rhodococcus koreensis]
MPTDDLFEYLCQLGRRQRDHHDRYLAALEHTAGGTAEADQ